MLHPGWVSARVSAGGIDAATARYCGGRCVDQDQRRSRRPIDPGREQQGSHPASDAHHETGAADAAAIPIVEVRTGKAGSDGDAQDIGGCAR